MSYDYETNESRNERLLATTYFNDMLQGIITLWGGIMKTKPTVAALAFVTAVLFWLTFFLWIGWMVLK